MSHFSDISKSAPFSFDPQITGEWLNTQLFSDFLNGTCVFQSLFWGLQISQNFLVRQSGSSLCSAWAIAGPLSPDARTSAAIYKWMLSSNGFWSSEIKEDISLCPSWLVEVWCGDQIVVIRLSSETFQSKTTGRVCNIHPPTSASVSKLGSRGYM